MTKSTFIPAPFTALRLTEDGLCKTVRSVCGSVTFGANGLPVSIVADGKELLSAPVRFVSVEDGETGVWDTDYPENESECFVQEHDDAHVILCGAMASERFVIDTAVKIAYDGNLDYDVKLAPRGRTVYQGFGLAAVKPLRYQLDRLWLEIPLKAEFAKRYQIFPNDNLHLADGTVLKMSTTTCTGEIPEQDTHLSFQALCWLGDLARGLGFSAESDAVWQPEDPQRVLEWIHGEDSLTLRVRLFDSHPKTWSTPPEGGGYGYWPLSFGFGLQTTPVKPHKPRELLRGLHIDCFRKTKGNYWDYLSGTEFEGLSDNTETGFDRISRLGVKTLILHEKWNKSQNFVDLSEYTRDQIRKIVAECHARGIRVLTYFGYEYPLMAYDWSEVHNEYARLDENGKPSGNWYRVPYQREQVCCYNSSWADRWIDGIAEIMDTCHTDGVYLDGTSRLWSCANEAHGCGQRDADGNLHVTYPVHAVRRLFERLYREVHARGGIINVHSSGAPNFTALPFIDLLWCGEDLQFDYTKGKFGDVPLTYYQTVYTGLNTGVPVELIAYENRPVWKFENALACSLIHGFLPRPNDIAFPLELMSGIWDVFDSFPIRQSEWLPYWDSKGVLSVSDSHIRASVYRYTAPDGEKMYLLLCANVTKDDTAGAEIRFAETVRLALQMPEKQTYSVENSTLSVDLPAYTSKIFFLKS